MPSLSVIRVGVTGVVFLIFLAVAVISVNAFGRPTYWFPSFIAIGGTLAAGYSFARDLRRVLAGESVVDEEVVDLGASVADAVGEDGEPEDPAVVRRRVFAWVMWLILLPVIALVIPFFFASLVWLVLVLRYTAKRSWLATAVSVGVFAVAFNVLVVLLELPLPPAILTGWG